MKSIVTIDHAGRLVLPKAVRDRLHLHAGSKLRVDVVGERVQLSPRSDEVTLVAKGRRLVIAGAGQKVDAVAALKADRDARLDRFSRG